MREQARTLFLEKARWICCSREVCVPVIEKKFHLPFAPTEGFLAVTGLGYFDAVVNGRNPDDRLFKPALTDYASRPLERMTFPLYHTNTHRVGYFLYDISAFLREGENLFSLTLAPGWFRQKERVNEGDASFGDDLPARFALLCSDGKQIFSFCSDGSETFRSSEIIRSNLYRGETIDANSAFDETYSVIPCDVSFGVLEEQSCPPDRIIRTIVPTLLKTEGDRRIYDNGENVTGWVSVTAGGVAGETVSLRFAEELDENGDLDFFSQGGSNHFSDRSPHIPQDVFISGGEKRVFSPRYTWHGFRYFEIVGPCESPITHVVHTDVKNASEFSSSDEGLNYLYETYLRTQKNNLHGCIPSDCPHRERLGYTGDGECCAETVMLLLDSEALYRKWIRDILDSQDVFSGYVPYTAPVMGGGGGPGGWSSAILLVPDAFYRVYGDENLLKACFPAVKKWLAYMRNHSDHGLVTHAEAKGWCLGDWASLEKEAIPEPYVNTCYFVYCLRLAEKIGLRLGAGDVSAFAAYRTVAERALRANYYDEATGSWCGDVQAANVFAVWCGLDEDGRAYRNMVSDYEKIGVFDMGFLAASLFAEALCRNGDVDLLYRMLSGEEQGTFLFMKRAGATTLWEYFNGNHSHDHPMFGAMARQLFLGFLGIGQEEDSVGFARPLIAPKIPKGLNEIEGSLNTKAGRISVKYRRTENGETFDVFVPKPCRFLRNGEEMLLRAGDNHFVF